MLRRLYVKDFVIVDQLELEFEPGFCVFTGETGAGKSILIDALALALGERAGTDLLRAGAASAEVAAEFELNEPAAAWLADNGFPADAEPALLLRRIVDAQGRSRGWINGSPATAAQLRQLGESLVDIFGQHAHQRLMRAAAVRALYDDYAAAPASACAAAHAAWRDAAAALEAARSRDAEAARERERLAFELAELERLAPGDQEWDELNRTHQRLAHGAELLELAQQAVATLDGGDGGDGGAAVLTQLAALAPRLRHAADTLDARLAPAAELLEAALVQAEEASRALQAYGAGVELDAGQLQQLDERIGAWHALARRLRRPPAELPALLAERRAALAALDAAHDLQALAAAEQAARARFDAAARALSQARHAARAPFEQAVGGLLAQLAMQGARLEVALTPRDGPAAHGVEDVELLFAGHAGVPLRPLAKVASGGELSRVALAVALACSSARDADAAPGTLIFDEVDAGIGGATAVEVGRLLARLARHDQVLCVTHLAQVAAHAGQHVRIDKQDGSSRARLLAADERSAEIARMLGAIEPGASPAQATAVPKHGAVALAEAMLRDARQRQQEL
jgi:DNA repair protein RecN (Recombination protein N)